MGYTLARLELSLENNFNNADHTKTLSVRELYIYIYIYIYIYMQKENILSHDSVCNKII